MQRYNFCFSLLVLLYNSMVFCGHDSSLNMYVATVFDKEDVAKYWLIKQLSERGNKDVLTIKINPLLASLKQRIFISESAFFKTKKIVSKKVENEWEYFRFNEGLNFFYLSKPIVLDSSDFRPLPIDLWPQLK